MAAAVVMIGAVVAVMVGDHRSCGRCGGDKSGGGNGR